MTPVKLIASDLDRTLLLDDSSLPAGIFDRIKALHAAGIEFVAASGRGVYTLEDLFAPVREQMSFLAENGGVLKHAGQVVGATYLTPVQVAEIVNFVRTQDNAIAIGNGLDATYLDARERQYQPALSSFITRFKIAPDLAKLDAPLAKLSLYFPHGGAYDAIKPIYQPRFGQELALTVGGPTFIDVMPKTTNKGHGLTQLGAVLGIAPEAMMAFGDTNNDIEMMQTVGYPVLVDNATENMWQYGKYHTKTNQQRGVLAAIDRVLAGELPALIDK
ncbi:MULTISPECIES: HAD-IIB family hydrolase [unclassified Lacticaseibacillus]|uniref:HAD-IIB family hydrolase n=1 Tax=unclassified Lacticaseibacillus TaxID=2759744 RepID=UPI001940E1D0|nr:MULTISPECIES: HAD-IIB family hydrolase [unclassified Lacticaseibacillus]